MSRKSKPKSGIEITDRVLKAWPLPEINEHADKDEKGKAFIIAGCAEMPGVILLTANSTLRAGAGKVKIAAPAPVAQSVALALPETFVLAHPTEKNGAFKNRITPRLSQMLADVDALLIGPGMAASSSNSSFFKKSFLAAKNSVVVFDAEALNIFSQNPSWAVGTGTRAILTPHAGEMAHLTGKTKDYVTKNAAALAVDFAKKSDSVVVLKGAKTYIASPNGEVFINVRGNKGLAASGSGDCLAGLITGLAARGSSPLQAAVWGVYLHALAGEALAKKFGEIGYLTRELAAEIPALLSKLKGPSRKSRKASSSH